MENSDARSHPGMIFVNMPAWKAVASTGCAVLLACVFLLAGVWKIVDTYTAATLMIQAKVPGFLGIPAAVGFGILETTAGVLLLVPRLRQWGAWLTGLLLLAFMGHMAFHYQELRGQECSCFPWLKRTVGPGFFIGDAMMLAMAVVAGVWGRRSEGVRILSIIFGAISVFALASFGITYARQTGTPAPSTITVNGAPYSLAAGKHLLYFFDPECSHCFAAAKTMSSYKWSGVRVVGIPTAQPRFAAGFMDETGLKAPLSNDLVELRKLFPFVNAPFAVAVENGRQKGSFIDFEGDQPAAALKKIGFIE